MSREFSANVLKDFLESYGSVCPYCKCEDQLEGYHSLEFEDGESRWLVSCGECGEQHTQIFEFECWLHDDDVRGKNERNVCPSCGSIIAENQYFELNNEGFGVLQGEFVCDECGESAKVMFKLKGFE